MSAYDPEVDSRTCMQCTKIKTGDQFDIGNSKCRECTSQEER